MTPLDALRAEGWRVEVTTEQGRPYYRAWRGGYRRGSPRPEGLLEMCRRAPRPAEPVQLRLPMREAA